MNSPRQKNNGSSTQGCLAFEPFGSKPSDGSGTGAFGWQENNSNIYNFELGSTSSSSSLSCSAKGSEPNSMLTFGTVPKKFNCKLNPFSNEYKMGASGGSSRNSSGNGSTSRLDWSEMVESVFKEEIGKMAED